MSEEPDDDRLYAIQRHLTDGWYEIGRGWQSRMHARLDAEDQLPDYVEYRVIAYRGEPPPLIDRAYEHQGCPVCGELTGHHPSCGNTTLHW